MIYKDTVTDESNEERNRQNDKRRRTWLVIKVTKLEKNGIAVSMDEEKCRKDEKKRKIRRRLRDQNYWKRSRKEKRF